MRRWLMDSIRVKLSATEVAALVASHRVDAPRDASAPFTLAWRLLVHFARAACAH